MKKGIDVSYANGFIDWSKAKNDISFAIIRSSFGSDLPSQIDSYFYQNANGCKKNGIPFGIYHFAYFIDEATAKAEADFAIRLANEYKDRVKFIALDIEEDSENYAKRVGASPNWTNCAIVFLEKVKSAGYTPVLYSNQSWLQNQLDFDRVKKYKLWYAAPGAGSPKYSCAIWQYSWSGKINGISGDVDMNYLYDESLFSTNKKEPAKKKSVDELAKEVIAGKWGAGEERKKRLTDAGYDYYAVQNRVNGIMGVKPKKTVDQLAKEVINGKWGAGEERKKKLTNAGYDYYAVQKKVNEMMGVSATKIKKGSIVRVRSGAKTYNGVTLASFVFTTNYYVMELQGDRAVIGIDGNVTAAVKVSDLILVK